MQYKIASLVQNKVNGVVTRRLLTLEVTYQDGSTSEHGFELLAEDIDSKQAAIKYAAQLEGVLKERPVVIEEEVALTDEEKEIKDEDVQAKVVELENEKSNSDN